MTERPRKRGFAARPADPESWVKASDASSIRASNDGGFSARLTIDVTSDQRARIKIAAFQRGVTVADMLRELLAREFPTVKGDPS
ncbi:hypothetical protein [Novosphingobium sp. HII-3]|jgi:hypothetical protein|uniref:hypothetical protein n=1 Tax=Novosphingobium sp. HII-3 TaxID=2075565 RepID=UPI000CDB1697|nr:hypothetical protein [Novosphingobium sp. HII-3]RTL91042.1 hypothetical protein EJV44_20740 [Ancylobacter aquaticus]